jgi:uncharacterized protein YjbI with pentapeptide repeats
LLGGAFFFIDTNIQEYFRAQQEQLDLDKEDQENQRREDEKKAEELKEVAAKAEEEARRKDTIIFEFSSSDNAIAILAAMKLKEEGWINDGSLRGLNISYANLEGINERYFDEYYFLAEIDEDSNIDNTEEGFQRFLEGCKIDVEGSRLHNSNLSGACLSYSNFQGVTMNESDLADSWINNAIFYNTKLAQSNLSGVYAANADFSNADLTRSVLSYSDFSGANFSGSNLRFVDFENANLIGATFNEETILPDSSNWAEDVDMDSFTNPDHPNFFAYIWKDRYSPPTWYFKSEAGELEAIEFEIFINSNWLPGLDLICYPVEE